MRFLGVFVVTVLCLAAAVCGLWMAFVAFVAYRIGFAEDAFAVAVPFLLMAVGIGGAVFCGWLMVRLNRWYAK